jgi:hypothetical protein
METTFTSPLFCRNCTNTPNDGTDVPAGKPRMVSALGIDGPRKPAARPDNEVGENKIEFTSLVGSEPPKSSDWLEPDPTPLPPCHAKPMVRFLSTDTSRMTASTKT